MSKDAAKGKSEANLGTAKSLNKSEEKSAEPKKKK